MKLIKFPQKTVEAFASEIRKVSWIVSGMAFVEAYTTNSVRGDLLYRFLGVASWLGFQFLAAWIEKFWPKE